MFATFWNFPSILLGQQFVKQNCLTTRLCVPGQIQNLLTLASRVFEPNRRCEVLEKAISRIRSVLLLWETNKRLKRARFNSKQAIKNRSILVFRHVCFDFWFWRESLLFDHVVQLTSSFRFLSGSDRPHKHERYTDSFLSTFESVSKLIRIRWIRSAC